MVFFGVQIPPGPILRENVARCQAWAHHWGKWMQVCSHPPMGINQLFQGGMCQANPRKIAYNQFLGTNQFLKDDEKTVWWFQIYAWNLHPETWGKISDLNIFFRWVEHVCLFLEGTTRGQMFEG